MQKMVIDGQAGGIGSVVIKGLREGVGNNLEVVALGTNSIATSRMMKGGANKGGTGENAIVHACRMADVTIGSLSILIANSMMGEVTPRMAAAVGSSEAKKIFIPLTQEHVVIVGVSSEPLPHLGAQLEEMIREMNKDV